MVVMKQYIDLSLIDNQKLVAQDWVIYRERIIINEELRYQIEQFFYQYQDGILVKAEFYYNTLILLQLEYKSIKN